jgi:hypothetical protein
MEYANFDRQSKKKFPIQIFGDAAAILDNWRLFFLIFTLSIQNILPNYSPIRALTKSNT